MNTSILNAANLYARGLKEVMSRRNEWQEKFTEVKNHLKEIASYLNEKSEYGQRFFVDVSYAFNEEINGHCSQIPSVTFRSGEMPLNIAFKNASGEKREYVEEGFHLTMTPTITGHVIVMLRPHHSSLTGEIPEYQNLALIEYPGRLTKDMIDQIVVQGIERAFHTSYTGISFARQEDSDAQKAKQYVPIGFRRTETTQKISGQAGE